MDAAARRQIPLSILQLDEPDLEVGVYGQTCCSCGFDHLLRGAGTGSKTPNADTILATALGWGGTVGLLHALVIGAGIGGTAAAIASRRAGPRRFLVRADDAQREVGAGIQISPNASRLLGRYGLGDAMARAAVRLP